VLERFESFIGINPWTALFVLLNFLLLFFIAKKYLFKPVKDMIDSRQKEIDTMYADAEAAKANADAMETEYKNRLATAQQTGDDLVKEAMARGQAREEEIIRKANADAAAIMDKASADIAMEKKKALNDAKDEISGLAMAIAGKVVGRELSDADQSKLIDSFIDELGDQI
jgi:F-type H+-transporting ATPase subunit b